MLAQVRNRIAVDGVDMLAVPPIGSLLAQPATPAVGGIVGIPASYDHPNEVTREPPRQNWC
jgi:hypothetical protein